jgi:hypothetical protein
LADCRERRAWPRLFARGNWMPIDGRRNRAGT